MPEATAVTTCMGAVPQRNRQLRCASLMAGLASLVCEPASQHGNSQGTKDKDSHSHLYKTELCAFYKVRPEPEPTLLKSSHALH